jgi:hypothetical protein
MSDTRKKLDDLVSTVKKEEYQPVTEAVEKTADNLISALGMVADELKFGFQRVRQAISEKTKE